MKPFNPKSIALAALAISFPFSLCAQGLRITRGANVVVSGEATIVLQDAGMVNQGSFAGGKGTLFFTGSEAKNNSAISGNGLMNFHNVTIDLPSGRLLLENNIALNGVLALRSGNLELNRYNLDLGSNGFISGENSNARIMGSKGGTVTATAMLNAPQNVNPGNIGLVLTSAANMGTTIVTRGHLPQTNASGQSGIERYYEIRPAYNNNAAIDVRFQYLEAELGDHKKTDLALWSDAGNGWTLASTERNDVNANWMLGKPNASGRFTLGPGNNNSFVKMAGLQSIQTYPNPAQEKFTLSVTGMRNMRGHVLLQDDHGRTLEKRAINYRIGTNTIEWNISRHAAGTYYLVFENMAVQSVKIVKQ